mgnify:CR=1 FL=1
MEKNQNVEIIRRTIINMDKPFQLTELFQILNEEYGITDIDLIIDVLNYLIDTGLVSMSEIDFDVWAYESNLV